MDVLRAVKNVRATKMTVTLIRLLRVSHGGGALREK